MAVMIQIGRYHLIWMKERCKSGCKNVCFFCQKGTWQILIYFLFIIFTTGRAPTLPAPRPQIHVYKKSNRITNFTSLRFNFFCEALKKVCLLCIWLWGFIITKMFTETNKRYFRYLEKYNWRICVWVVFLRKKKKSIYFNIKYCQIRDF